jgi:hypothetical protein
LVYFQYYFEFWRATLRLVILATKAETLPNFSEVEMKRNPVTGSTSAKPTEGSATHELVCIPVGTLTVPLPESLADVVAGPAPWPVILSVSRVWIGRRHRRWELHFGQVESLPLPPGRE